MSGTFKNSIRYIGGQIMFEGNKQSNEKINTLQEFTLMFWKDKILIDNLNIPLGEASTEILNFSDEAILDMFNARNEAIDSMRIFFNDNIKKDLAVVTDIQNKLNKVLDLAVDLPPFKYLFNNGWSSMLINIFNTKPLGLESISNRYTHNGEILYHFFFKVFSIIDEVISFNGFVSNMLTYYFENLKKRNEEYYAVGVYKFFTDIKLLNGIRSTLPPIPSFDFSQIINVGIQYTPTRNPENEKQYILAERIVFDSMKSFLYYDLFKGLINGHCPRRCHNCGKYFLLLSGHNTCYCSNIAPNQKKKGETKTCREVGAHVKETQKKEKRTPARQEYDKVYNRLKSRKNRGKISVDEWNQQVSKAISYMEQNQRGELSDYDYMEIMKKL